MITKERILKPTKSVSTLRAMPYFGGKSPLMNVGNWIAKQLPYGRYYVEPFAGMCGVLLKREQSLVEVVNDADERIINWWRHVRDHPDEMAWMIEKTPHSREELRRAWAELDDPDPLRRALNTHIVLWSSFRHGLGGTPSFPRSRAFSHRMSWDQVHRLCERMSRVTLESKDACFVIESYVNKLDAVLYIDPPYKNSDVKTYGVWKYDENRLSELICDAKSYVAISGKDGDWDHLGFHKKLLRSKNMCSKESGSGSRTNRMEALYFNQDLQAMRGEE